MFRNIAGIFRNILKTAFRNTGLALICISRPCMVVWLSLMYPFFFYTMKKSVNTR